MSTDSTYLRAGKQQGATQVSGGNILRADRSLLDLGRGPSLARDERPGARRADRRQGESRDADIARQP